MKMIAASFLLLLSASAFATGGGDTGSMTGPSEASAICDTYLPLKGSLRSENSLLDSEGKGVQQSVYLKVFSQGNQSVVLEPWSLSGIVGWNSKYRTDKPSSVFVAASIPALTSAQILDDQYVFSKSAELLVESTREKTGLILHVARLSPGDAVAIWSTKQDGSFLSQPQPTTCLSYQDTMKALDNSLVIY